MSNFKNYASYYNLLYNEKNYQAETNYVLGLINKYSTSPTNTILDLGCGTGSHDILLAQNNIKVTEVDLSAEMIEIANKKQVKNCQFLKGDVRTIELNKTFDIVVSLFHVASYQNTNQDFENFLSTAHKHLKKDGLFIFDFWYGPAVLTDLPVVRVKRLEDNAIKITRISEPVFYPNKNSVDVNFEVQIENKQDNTNEKVTETHNMRYWFLPEIEYLATKNGFTILNSFEWMTENKMNFNSWNGIIILKK